MGAAMFLWCGVAGAATVITDPSGDANGLGNAGLDVTTAPASDGARDLTQVTISSDREALTVAYTTSEPLVPSQVGSQLRLRLTTPTCPVTLLAGVGGGQDARNVAVADAFDCGAGLSLGGYSLTSSGSTWVARFPFDALKRAKVPITASTSFTGVYAESMLNDGIVYIGDTVCSSEDPHGCDVDHLVWPKLRSRYYIGAIVDRTAAVNFKGRKR